MHKKPVLSVVGGGSYFTPSFIGTMIKKPEIWAGCEVRLHDPGAPERVRMVKAFCEKYVSRKKAHMTFVPQPDLDKALEGADIVITTFRIGGVKALTLDETIPPRFGYIGDETAGPGGMFMAIRTVPVVVDIARRMERLCPDAWLLNYANPTHFITAGVAQATRTKVIGLCDNYICPLADISWLLGMDEVMWQIKARHAGYNHCNWAYSAEYKGQDLLQELRDKEDTVVKRNLGRSEKARMPFTRSLSLFKETRWLPVGQGHFLPYFYQAEYLERQLNGNGRAHAAVAERTRQKWDQLESQLTEYKDEIADQVARTQHGGAHADLAIGVASALLADTGEEFPVNVPHQGAVPGFAPATVVEHFARVWARGCEPVKIPAFPPMIMTHQQLLFGYLQLVVEGILEKDRHKIFQGLLIHPFTRSATRARELFDTMWKEERDVHGAYWDGV